MPEFEVHITEAGSKGTAYIGSAISPDAEMTYSKAGETRLIIDHTEVSEKLRGQGAGRVLLDCIVNMAREKELKILPLCPFARSQFSKDPSIRDVL